jgi:hypothetical protein
MERTRHAWQWRRLAAHLGASKRWADFDAILVLVRAGNVSWKPPAAVEDACAPWMGGGAVLSRSAMAGVA